jgi:hypothetical protein
MIRTINKGNPGKMVPMNPGKMVPMVPLIPDRSKVSMVGDVGLAGDDGDPL